MTGVRTGGLVAIAVGTMLAAASPAAAQLAQPQTAATVSGDSNLLTAVQYRGHWRGHRHWDGHRHWRGGYGGPRYGWYGPGLGFATGALIGGALAAAPRAYYDTPSVTSDEIAYCSRRFKSYDPSSGTYLGYDGNRHPCP